jgi:hypothetical protein
VVGSQPLGRSPDWHSAKSRWFCRGLTSQSLALRQCSMLERGEDKKSGAKLSGTRIDMPAILGNCHRLLRCGQVTYNFTQKWVSTKVLGTRSTGQISPMLWRMTLSFNISLLDQSPKKESILPPHIFGID